MYVQLTSNALSIRLTKTNSIPHTAYASKQPRIIQATALTRTQASSFNIRFVHHVLQKFLGQTSVSTLVKMPRTLIPQNIGRKQIYPFIRLSHGIHAETR